MTQAKKDDIKVLMLIAAAIIILVWGYNFLKGKDVFMSTNSYYMNLNSSHNLVKGSPVLIKGVKVGSVEDLILDYKTQKVIIKIIIPAKYKLNSDAQAEVFSPGIMDGESVQILMGNQSNHFLSDGDSISTSVQMGMLDKLSPQLDEIVPELKGTLKNTNSLTSNFDKTFNQEAQKNLQMTLANLSQTSASLAKFTSQLSHNSKAIDQSMNNLQSFTGNLARNNEELNQVVKNLNAISNDLSNAEFAQTVKNLNQSVSQFNSIMSKVNSDDGSLGLLLNDKKLYQDMTNTLESVSNLLDDLRKHPSRYVNLSLIGGRKEKCDEE